MFDLSTKLVRMGSGFVNGLGTQGQSVMWKHWEGRHLTFTRAPYRFDASEL